MGSQAYEGFDRLVEMSRSGELAAICRTHDVTLLVVFGSVLDPGAAARDLDMAVRFDSQPSDVLALLDDLSRQLHSDQLDVMVLNGAGPVAREQALVAGRPLYQRAAGDFATAQIAAIMERLDTDWLRALDLELMSQ